MGDGRDCPVIPMCWYEEGEWELVGVVDCAGCEEIDFDACDVVDVGGDDVFMCQDDGKKRQSEVLLDCCCEDECDGEGCFGVFENEVFDFVGMVAILSMALSCDCYEGLDLKRAIESSSSSSSSSSLSFSSSDLSNRFDRFLGACSSSSSS